MQNKNETNENVNKVVAEFFKSKPLAKQNNNHRRRPFHHKNESKSDKEPPTDKKAVETQSYQ
ncbi:MAG: hypothetical protein IJD67_05125, partial [Clostridia bacterium]|nr:hypothetical protein [Clostridia bacterium]